MRRRLIEQFRRRLDRDGFPRLEMTGIVGITAVAGFVASWALLEFAGMRDMTVRYPCAVAMAYAFFVGSLWLWLRVRIDVSGDPGGSGSSEAEGGWDGHGGSSGGAGSSASWGSSASSVPASTSSDSSATDSIDIGIPDVDEPEGWLVLAAIAVIGVAVIAGVYLVWIAPGLLAEIVLDAALAGGLYRRLRRIERQHWLQTVLQRTVGPFLVTAIVLGGIGSVAERAYPGIDSINDVLDASSGTTSRDL